MTIRAPFAALTALSLAGVTTACRERPSEGDSVHPPVESTGSGACASGGGQPGDAVTATYFPQTVAGYCVDPHGEVRAYGERASGTLVEACTELFDGECEIYEGHGLRRVVTLRYVDGARSPGAVFVTLSRFASKEGAYGFFTHRVVAGGDPRAIAVKPLQAGGAGALGSGVAYVWRGQHVAELRYTNELESPDRMRETGSRILPALAGQLGDGLPGGREPPDAVATLPEQHRLPMGVRFVFGDLLDVAGTGGGAVGFYESGGKRWRVLSLVRPEEESAQDVIKTFKKLDGARKIKDAPWGALLVPRRSADESPRVEWVLVRRDRRVLGVGDEELALSPEQTEEERRRSTLTIQEKLDVLRPIVVGGS